MVPAAAPEPSKGWTKSVLGLQTRMEENRIIVEKAREGEGQLA
ncbi:MAG: hypothetical protein WCC94_03475 [Candidatus Bathyarchaeia archaeon]